MTDMLSHIKHMQQELRQRDPLLQRGIERDWVCVIHPALVSALEAQFKQLYDGQNMTYALGQHERLRILTGRTVYIIDAAPMGGVEYMPEAVMRQKYAAWFEFMQRLLDSATPAPAESEGDDDGE